MTGNETYCSGPVEIRAEAAGRTLTGVLVPFGKVSPSHRERFLPGSLTPAPRGVINAAHDRSRAISGWPDAVEFRETADGFEATITVDDTDEARQAVEEVRAGRLNGFSVEFNRALSSMVDGVREVREAVLIGVGLVSAPSYPGTVVQLRHLKSRAWIT